MDVAQMVSRVRTLLDEATEGNWSDAEIYSALSDAQYKFVTDAIEHARNKGTLQPVSRVLLNITESVNSSGADVSSGVNAPSDFLDIIGATYAENTGTKYRCRIVNYDGSFDLFKDNAYLSPSTKYPIVYWRSKNDVKTIYFLPSSASADYELIYAQNVPILSGSQESILPPDLHGALVKMAYQDMLEKYRGGKFDNQ